MAGSKKATYFDALKQKHGVDEPSAETKADAPLPPQPIVAEGVRQRSTVTRKHAAPTHLRRQLRVAIVVLAAITTIALVVQIFSRAPAMQSQTATRTEPSAVHPTDTRVPIEETMQAEILEIDEQDRSLLPEAVPISQPTEDQEALSEPLPAIEPELDDSDSSTESGREAIADLDPVVQREPTPESNPPNSAPLPDPLPEIDEPLDTTPSPDLPNLGTEASSSTVASSREDLPDPEADVFVPATRISGNQPHYPPSALASGIGGIVTVEVEIDEQGAVTGTRVLEGPHPDLDRAAQEAIETWRFQPATLNGTPQLDTYRARIRFAPPESYQPAVRIRTPLPEYPQSAFVAGTEGIVTLRATIDDQGDVINIEVIEGLPYGLSEAAIEAVRGWKFRPALSDGVPTISQQTLRIRFGR